jgi:hypothetical protein
MDQLYILYTHANHTYLVMQAVQPPRGMRSGWINRSIGQHFSWPAYS